MSNRGLISISRRLAWSRGLQSTSSYAYCCLFNVRHRIVCSRFREVRKRETDDCVSENERTVVMRRDLQLHSERHSVPENDNTNSCLKSGLSQAQPPSQVDPDRVGSAGNSNAAVMGAILLRKARKLYSQLTQQKRNRNWSGKRSGTWKSAGLESLEQRLVLSVQVAYAVISEWNSGYQAELTIENNTPNTYEDWVLEFDYPHTISSIWNAEVQSVDGEHYAVQHPAWDGTISPGETVSLGYLGVRNGAVSEPQNFRLNGESTGDGPSEPVTPEIFVNDVEVSEGDSGNTTAVFTVTLSEAAAAPVTGTAVWRDDSATGSSDYLGTSQQFTFDPGETQLSVPVEIIGDTDVEQDELFFVDLQNVTGAVSGDLTGQATILNDDQSQTDPPHDCVEIEFLVTSDWGSGFNGEIRLTNRGETAWSEWTLEFDFGRDLTAIWNAELLSHIGDHYTVRDAGWNGIVAPGVTRSFGFTANPGNVTVEPQNYRLNGSVACNGHGSRLSIDSISVTEGDTGLNAADFTVTLDQSSESTVTVDYSTSGGTATSDSDFQAASGTITFAPGTTSQTVTVMVHGDTTDEVNETFLVSLLNATGAVIAGSSGVGTIVDDDTSSDPPPSPTGDWPDQFFAPYVDFTGWPPFDLVQTAQDQDLDYYNLGFVVADPTTSQPSWGGYYTTESAYRLEEIEALRDMGGDVIVSFGGAANTELAVALTDVEVLTDAYQSVIDTYGLTMIDFDIEGAWVADRESIDRRSRAIDLLQERATQNGADLEVFFTLPVLPEGLTHDGVYVLQSAIDAGVEIDGVNIMAMDYGRPGTDMGRAAIDAATSLHGQLDSLYDAAGSDRSDAALWKMVGVTPMIGVNDTGERFYTDDAEEVLTFAEQQNLRMLSMWSIQRDNQGVLDRLSNSSSGVPQSPYEFSQIFNGFTDSHSLSISDVTAFEGDPLQSSEPTFLHTEGNQVLDAQGNVVRIAGVSWFGMESDTFSPHGLWARNWQEMMDEMHMAGFNTIRLPYANQVFDSESTPAGIDFSLNPDLVGLSGLELIDRIVDYAEETGLRILLDHHRSDAGAGPNENGLWYQGEYGEERWITDWVMLAERYAGRPTVIGADLHNEPHGQASWGTGDLSNDWRLAAERAGNAIQAVNPDWLLVVEGIQNYQDGSSYWWGGNLELAGEFPVRLDVDNRLVYSPHAYPESIYAQPWFDAGDYPQNLPSVWDRTWGYLFKENVAPILLGEFGSRLETASDVQWVDSVIGYLDGDFDLNGIRDLPEEQQGMGWTWWSWNPNSGDTGGILQDDWRTLNTEKVEKLESIQFEFPNSDHVDTVFNFTVSLSTASDEPVTVTYQTEGDTADPLSDFQASSGQLVFAPGEISQTISIIVFRDPDPEADETFYVDLSSAVGARLADDRGTGTVRNDDNSLPTGSSSLSTSSISVLSELETPSSASDVFPESMVGLDLFFSHRNYAFDAV